MRSLRTPLGQARGLGSAKDGVGHFIGQRVSAVALVILVSWFLVSLVLTFDTGFVSASQWVAKPWNAVGLILLLTAAFYHMRLGAQIVIEDYINGHGLRTALLIANTFFAATLWVASVFAVLKIAL